MDPLLPTQHAYHLMANAPGVMPEIFDADIQVDEDSLVTQDSLTNLYTAKYQNQPARLKEYRSLRYHDQHSLDVRSALRNEALLRRRYHTASHVPVVGIYETGPDLGSRTCLVEAPYQSLVGLKEHLIANPDADRISLLRRALAIIADLHDKGLVLGPFRLDSFTVDSDGELLLSGLEELRIENTTTEFRPIRIPSLTSMLCMAPELLHSLISDGSASLTRATDMYAMACFSYELFTGSQPFESEYSQYRKHIAEMEMMIGVAGGGKLPERPPANSDAFNRFGLTQEIYTAIEGCFSSNSAARPSAHAFLAQLTLV